MPGLAGALCDPRHYSTKEDLVETIDLLGVAEIEAIDLKDGFMAAASLKNAPLKGNRCYEDDTYAAGLAGDLVGVGEIPWRKIVGAIRSGDYAYLAELRGNFSIAVWDKVRRRLFIATDSRGQQPIHYRTFPGGVIFSTEMSTFCRLTESPSPSITWLYQMVFFNWPLWQTTFIEGVHAVLPGSFVVYDLATNEISTSRYMEPFRKSEKIIRGKEGLDRALSVFRSRVPKYFEGADNKVLLGLSGGWDSRTILSLCPPDLLHDVDIYSYGVKGHNDLSEATRVVKALGLKQLKIFFDENLLEQMRRLMADAVYTTSGTQSVLRAPMLYVFEILNQSFDNCPIIITGTSFDALFKGYANVPVVFSPDMHRSFSEGRPVITRALYEDIFEKKYDDFAAQVMTDLEMIRNRYGDFGSAECPLNYLLYDACAKFFLGEMDLASHFSTFRVPCWDDDITRLAYEIENSRLRFSYYAGSPDPCEHNRLHTYLLRSNPDFATLPVAGFPLSVWWRGGITFTLYRALVKGPRTVLAGVRKPRVPLVDWKTWIKTSAVPVADELIFSPDSLVREYIGNRFLERQRETRTAHWIGKLMTIEVILRQLRTGWRSPIP